MERIVSVVPKDGLHARPASQFVETANSFDAEITLGRVDDDSLVPAASMLAVTGLGVSHGEEIRLVADGDDAEAALDALEDVLSTPESGDEASEN
ncbi:HPr family phosphocarrier protein [Haloferax mediterranei ATCC 33500]|uniref:HPr family phosphocarrier protein n=1 Tax=Haloferax mediterranei (strain ATCC 33500 / DSM 1411 / JCM 8866 / NBRC 14739 / NCIMB 2177 / R-4) TaxID=523841 RepID=I3R500_HALMT|nr:phosphocarrier protein HPr [Haloferax mediterranei]AFK19310.1 phosphocarrier protein Hpr [Haloferax mediterranei ATCC 33500]AHZ21333.1 phosphocarrier protein HPr [Haloferax mediterranei ATCC 33500]EMA04501.1 phosphocarrier protein Hpr [Haloferax mediterranei ATCC 33500]MDX5989414.1 phosphocarrier protein HPr [Haloferax mediterranei ATCC 33500]QCQ75778.1 HPr family phosphocarrier protein [Haloferax mediterranei ATCC 33500]